MPKPKRPPQKNKTGRTAAKSVPAAASTVRKKTTATAASPKPPKKRISWRGRVKPEKQSMVGAFRLFGRSLLVLRRHWRLFFGITVVYAVLNLLLVHGLAGNGNLQSIKSTIDDTKLSGGLTLFVYLLGGSSSASSANANAGVYQTLLIILVSLALIWSLRQVYNNQRPRIRDGFYRGIYPLVPFILVLLVIGLQLIPMLIGGFLYSTVISNGIAAYTIEKIIWALVFVGLALTSLHMICSSLFALYVVTLPDMNPMKALRSARELVRYRRWTVLRKLLFLPLALLLITAIIMLPVIILLTPAAEWIYFILTMAALAVIHSYMYTLYRELLPHE